MTDLLPGFLFLAVVIVGGWWIRRRTLERLARRGESEGGAGGHEDGAPIEDAGVAVPAEGSARPPAAGPGGGEGSEPRRAGSTSRGGTLPGSGGPAGDADPSVDPEGALAEDRPSSGRTEVGREHSVPGHDLRFTVYRPGSAVPGRWHDLLVFIHEFVRPSVELATELPPEERIVREARRILGEDAAAYVTSTEDAAAAVPREGELTFVVELPGCVVNPPSQTVAWHEDLQHVRFRFRAGTELPDTTCRGHLAVFHGPLLLAEMALVIPLGREEAAPVAEPVRSYRKIFASYAREDYGIVRHLEALSASVGDRYLRDLTTLRTGEEWSAGLARLIEEADVFQLFWSWNAMESEWVRREWTHALGLGRRGFVRPVYWEDPLPSHPDRGLPPPELGRLHFHRLPVALAGGSRASARPAAGPATASLERAPSASPPPESTPSPAPASTRSPRPAPSSAPAERPPDRSRSLLWGLPAVAVLVLALGTSTLMLEPNAGARFEPEATTEAPDEPTGGSARTEAGGGSQEPAAAEDRLPRPAVDSPRESRPATEGQRGHLVAQVLLDGSPLAGVTVRIRTADGRTDRRGVTSSNGRVSFGDLPPGPVRLVAVDAPGEARFVSAPTDPVVLSGDTTHLVLRGTRSGGVPRR